MRETPKGVSASHDCGSECSCGFLVVAYVLASDGVPRPVAGMDQCPQAVGGERCDLWKHHVRERKTGPCFGLWVMRCRTHAIHFTAYPHGHVPYGRQRVAPVSPAGSVTEKEGGRRSWKGTLFRGRAGRSRRSHLATGHGGQVRGRASLCDPETLGGYGSVGSGVEDGSDGGRSNQLAAYRRRPRSGCGAASVSAGVSPIGTW